MTLIRVILAYVVGMAATLLIFLFVAWLTGELSAGVHGNAVVVLAAGPFLMWGAYRLMVRIGFPPDDPPESQ